MPFNRNKLDGESDDDYIIRFETWKKKAFEKGKKLQRESISKYSQKEDDVKQLAVEVNRIATRKIAAERFLNVAEGLINHSRGILE